MREYDLTIAIENVFAELLDLQASDSLDHEVQAHEIVEMLEERYHALWDELTAEEEFSTAEMWRIEQRVERLNDLGFDVDELDIVTDWDGEKIEIQPKVVELGHHQPRAPGASPGCTSRTRRPGGCSTTSRRSPPTSTSAARTAPWSPTGG